MKESSAEDGQSPMLAEILGSSMRNQMCFPTAFLDDYVHAGLLLDRQ